MRTEIIDVGGKKYTIRVYYENRNNSRISITKKSINIRIPLSINREQQLRELINFKRLVEKKIKQNLERFIQVSEKEYKNGDIIRVGNKEYVIKIALKDKQGSSARLVGNCIELIVSSNLPKYVQNKHIANLISRVVGGKRLSELKDKINKLNKEYFNNQIRNVKFKNLSSRWGSCSEKGNINISTRLLFAPDEVLEYVCLHELAHLVEFNHSERFWDLIQNVMPDYKEKERWLKENGNKCSF